MMALLSGCWPSVNSRVNGDWKMAQPEIIAKRMANQKQPSVEEAPTKLMMTLSFKSSGVIETVTQLGKINSRKTGTWKLLKKETAKQSVIECSIKGVVSQHKIYWIDESTMRMAAPNMSGQSMIVNFIRAE